MLTFLTIYLAGIGATYVSIKCLFKKTGTVDEFDFKLLLVFMFIPIINFIEAIVVFGAIIVLYLKDIIDNRRRLCQMKNRRSFFEVLFGIARQKNGCYTEYKVVEQKKKQGF